MLSVGVQVGNLYIRGYIVCEGCFFGVQVGNLYMREYKSETCTYEVIWSVKHNVR